MSSLISGGQPVVGIVETVVDGVAGFVVVVLLEFVEVVVELLDMVLDEVVGCSFACDG